MAIKGKKKQQRRGSQARRRPAVAPRGPAARATHVPWHGTPGGRVAAAIIVVILIAAIGGTIAAVSSNNRAEQDRAAVLDAYTGQVRTLLQEVSGPATQMAAFPAEPSAQELKALPDLVVRWRNGLRSAQNGADLLQPPDRLRQVNVLFVESIVEYLSTVETYEVASTVEGNARQRILDTAVDDRNRATALWTTAVALLDQERDESGLSASNIGSPILGPPPG
jgi:hypothetical protein